VLAESRLRRGLPRELLRLFALRLGFSFAMRLLLGSASCCVAPGLLLSFAPGLLLGFATSLRIGFTSSVLLDLAAFLLFRLATSLLLGFSSGLIFGLVECALLGFAPGLLLGLAARLLLGFATSLRFGFTSSLLLHLTACLLVRLAARLFLGVSTCVLLGFPSGLLLGLASRLFLSLPPGSGFGFATRLLLGIADVAASLLFGFESSLLLRALRPRFRLLGVDRVALRERLPLLRQAHLLFCALPPFEHVSDGTSDTAIWEADACKDRDMIPIEERFPRPSVMGVLNVTPDSFFDGGVHLDPDVAAVAARRMIEDGAAIVDVGGESTRPGSGGVSAGEELRRVVPVLDRLGGEIPLSIDTSKAAVAQAALERGAILVNDVRALRGDPELAGVVAGSGAYLCLMHMQGEPRTMQHEPRYVGVAVEVAAFLEERMAFAVAQGIPEERICLDPGIGFGKTVAQNLELVRRLDVLLALGRPVLVGFSRKSSLRRLTGSDDLLGASVAAAVAAFERGATILRVHDVRPTVDALTVAGAIA
jgi:dihydropteroate synthase